MSHHHHHDPPCCGCGCGCSAPAPPCGYYPAPPQPASGSDHLLHAIAAHLLLNSGAPPPSPQPQPQPQQHLPPQPQPQAPTPAPHHANLYSYAYQSQYQQAPAPPPPHHQQQPNPPDHGQLLLHSLLRRVAALETTLPGCFPSPPLPLNPNHRPRPQHRASAAHQEAPPSPPPPPRRRAPSEKELATRTIQVHFRRFLARRSRTLRQLKELAMLRSKAASLRGSLSGRRRCADPAAVSESVMRLLFHLDGIQGEDPMIREGKHAVSRELCRIIEFVDKVLLKDHQENNDEYPEGCRGARGVNRPTVNKEVSFHCNGAEKEADESCESSSSAEADERKGKDSKKTANGKPGLAAPVPVHMEEF